MTTPDRRNTIVGNGTNNVSSYSMLPINSNTSSHPVPQSNNISKAKKPPIFDGNTGWQDYLVQFEMVAAVNNWDDHTKAYEVATNLRGVAQGIVTEIEPLKRFDYTYLVSALTSRFEPVNQENMYKVQMNSYYRKSGQTLPEMAQDIRRITRLAYPTAPVDIRNQLGKDCFVRALNDSKIQLSIFQREPKTIDDCIRFGVEYEAFTLDQKRINNPKQGLRKIEETDESDDELVTRLSKISDQIGTLSFNTQNSDKIGNFKVTHKFTIANIDASAVIGYDFLHQYECTLELGKGVLIIGQNYIHCIKESQIESVFKVSITEKLTIPPNTEVITSCAIKGDASSIMNAMTQVLPSKHTDNLLIAKAVRDEVNDEIQRLLDCGVIEPSKSPWTSCIVPVTKKSDGSTRICIDFRPLKCIMIDALRGCKWLSVMDLSSGYWQVEMDDKDKEKTAFTSNKGLFHFNVMPMGLCNGVATFQRLMEYILAGLNWETCLIYIDDIIVFSDSFESHLTRLGDVLDRITAQGLKVAPKKCSFFKIKFLSLDILSHMKE
ncbi:unnamed protein product [Mytilus coruscus]|uniref:Reverse transcriptase domain-containing protein n=1 Tax=Mytilus coruscus TaxID=42192 RepID=A0A6J8D854_MYTCO|nr:unnamed protein product [Mytilus coruscus]